MIFLNNKFSNKWKNFESSYVRGFAYNGDILLDECGIYNTLIEAIDNNSLTDILRILNGNYSCVIDFGNYMYLISDKFRTYPLLYSRNHADWIISDNSKDILDNIDNCLFDDVKIAKLLAVKYLDKDETILKGVYNVNAGTYNKISKNSDKNQRILYSKLIFNKTSITPDEVINKGLDVADKAFTRIFNTIGKRRVVIPLSGGYDSRWIACMCKRLGITNVLCYTYGIKNSWEVNVSKQVAEKLGYEWHYVEYPQNRALDYSDTLYNNYLLFSNNLNTLSHSQDFYAIYSLIKANIINREDVIFPGHSGEILGGDQIPYDCFKGKSKVSELLFNYYALANIRGKYIKEIMNSFENDLKVSISEMDVNLAIDLYNNWNIQNRQSNFIINSVRIYDFFGIDWRIPLWEDELTKFWLSIQWKYKYNQELYNNFLFKNYFIPMGVEFYKPALVKKTILTKIKLPYNIKSMIKYFLMKIPSLKKMYCMNGFVKIDSRKEVIIVKKKYLKYESYDSNQNFTAALISNIMNYVRYK